MMFKSYIIFYKYRPEFFVVVVIVSHSIIIQSVFYTIYIQYSEMFMYIQKKIYIYINHSKRIIYIL